MYNARKPGDMNFYRTLGIDTPNAEMVSDAFWTLRQDEDPDWLTAVSSKPQGTPGRNPWPE